MKTVIMAGGKGTRLRPLTSYQPKPMIPIANRPCMEHIVNLLKRQGFEDLITTLGFMPEVIEDYFGDGSGWGVRMEHSVEEESMGTAGSIKLIEDRLTERFVVVSGDALTDADLQKAVSFHEERGAEATLILQGVDDPSEFGIVVTGDGGRVERFLEKPDPEEAFSYTANTGLYVLEPSVLKDIPEGEEYDFSEDLFPKLLDEGRPMYGYVLEEAYWEDIGNIQQYMDAQQAVLDGAVAGVRPPGEEIREGVFIGDGVEVDEGNLEGPVVLGDNVRIAAGAHVGPHSVIAPGASIGDGATVVRSTVADGSSIDQDAHLDGALVGRSCTVGAAVRLMEGSVLGDNVEVGKKASVRAGVSVFPGKQVKGGADLTESLTDED